MGGSKSSLANRQLRERRLLSRHQPERERALEHTNFVASTVNAVGSRTSGSLLLCSKQLVDQDVARILAAAKTPASVTTLNLGCNRIGAHGAAEVSRFLTRSGSVAQLDMRSNQISDQGLEHLVEALKKDATLLDLDLRRNELDDAGMELIASLLECNQTITRLDLRNNDQITVKGVNRIAAAVETSGSTTDVDVAWLGDEASRARLAAALENNCNSPMVLTLLWDPPLGRTLQIRCYTVSGREVASEQVVLSDTLASLKGALAQRLSIAAQRLVLILPDARVLEDASGMATLDRLLGL